MVPLEIRADSARIIYSKRWPGELILNVKSTSAWAAVPRLKIVVFSRRAIIYDRMWSEKSQNDHFASGVRRRGAFAQIHYLVKKHGRKR
ncbi:hypothetical protein C4F51_11260 [Cellvibrio sp. KB43]|uniref:Uncharacterized protein n=1 Tax=Cellvibrio polysaccharolyticus TaxID=2082724 RepID=A0A928YTP3_9GAMM|nr:hypothetical protein [Cellvibrio polysaccharolyticus]